MSVIKFKGIIKFNPPDKTNKHIAQSAWKVVAMVTISGEICEYYSWFIKTRYNLELNKPLRGAHVTFINDKMQNVKGNTPQEKSLNWEALKKKWDGKQVDIYLDPDARTDGKHWWLNIPEENRSFLQGIRDEVEMGRPFYGMHMSIGYSGMGYEETGKLVQDYALMNFEAGNQKFINKLLNKGILVAKDGKFIQHQKPEKKVRKHFIL